MRTICPPLPAEDVVGKTEVNFHHRIKYKISASHSNLFYTCYKRLLSEASFAC